MAEACANARHAELLSAESCGLMDLHLPASTEAIALVRERYSIDLSSRVSRYIRNVDPSTFDHVIALTPRIAEELTREHGVDASRITAWHVPDPVGAGAAEYEAALDMIEAHIDALVRKHGAKC
jgi:protein-tyrosine-phosphatase